MATKIIIDSSSDITKEEADSLGIIMLPMEILIDNQDYYDGVNISKEEFYNKLKTCSTLPKTSQISPSRFKESFEEICNSGNNAVVICISSKLSGTYNGANLAAKEFYGKIFVVDSRNVCIGERVLCFYALELDKKGYDAEKIANELDKVKERIRLFSVVDTLKYLRKGGRVSAISGFMGEVMSIKPIICVNDEGAISVIGKAIGNKKGHKMLIDLVKNSGGINTSMPFVLGYTGNDRKNIDDFVNINLKEILDTPSDAPVFCVGSTIGTHVGPGAIAIAYFEK